MVHALRADHTPFSEQQFEQLRRSLDTLDARQAQWLSGYLAGRLADPLDMKQSQPAPGAVLTVLFSSQTGNGEGVARALAESARHAGLPVEVKALGDFRPAALRKLERVAFVISTHGEGDPPDDALELFDYLDGDRAPQLPRLQYRVLALGDRSYQLFCEAGRRLDERLRSLGATAFGPRTDCDVDYGAESAAWSDQVLEYTRQQSPDPTQAAPAASLSVVHNRSAWTREQPLTATVARVQTITGQGSDKVVRHIELSLGDSGMRYEPGDALGVWAPNDPQRVNEILGHLGIAATAEVTVGGETRTIGEALGRHREITRLSVDTVARYARQARDPALLEHFDQMGSDDQRRFIEQRQLADLTLEFPARLGAQELVDLLRPLSARSYSIASSQQLVDDEVHLTVVTRRSNVNGVERHGVASHFLNHRLSVGDEIRVFPEPNPRFRLPDCRDTPLIMIASGTGVAPYRAFLQQLESEGTTPDTWLIFGNPHLRSDFLYQKEWLDYRRRGLLTRISVAFSRDQERKHYVQHVLRDEADRLQRWLERGARIYLCGSLAMGQAAEESLRDALAAQRGLDTAESKTALAELRRQKRLLKDLY